MKDKGKIIYKALAVSAVPSVVTYLGKTDNIIDYLYNIRKLSSVSSKEYFKRE